MFSKVVLPPKSLVALIVGITVAPLGMLMWLGVHLVQQDRVLEAQQAQQSLERAADLVVAALQRALAFLEQRLAAGSRQWPAGAVAVTFHENQIEAYPKERVAYFPMHSSLREAPLATFAEGEDLEFRKNNRAASIEVYRKLAKSSGDAIRAGALLRLARNLAGAGRTEEALAVYGQLASIDYVAINGVSAGLVGQYARCELLERTQRPSQLRAEAQQLASDLNSGRWTLTEAVYRLYTGDAARWTGGEAPGRGEAELFAQAVAALWEPRQSLPPSGREPLSIGARNLGVIWESSGGRLRALIASSEFVESQWVAAAATVAREHRISFRLGDTDNADAGLKARRSAKEAELPWSIVAISVDSSEQRDNFALRRRLLVAGFVLLAAMALTASYLIVRAVSRELAVARLQSDFVAAVSHEFRTPLTALRQFTEMLRENERLRPDEGKERRILCYEAQSRATDRLTKLVESLLDFGRMEAGARRYRFEQRDCTELVGRVVDDFREEIKSAGYDVEFRGNGSAPIEVDSEALARAVWNLLDNAVKYSPDHRTIQAGVESDGSDVRIAIRDRGIGIPAGERAAIFSKFQRGEQARKRGIQGTGIGLAIVDEIVKVHHGRIEVESDPGKGSTFTIVLPQRNA